MQGQLNIFDFLQTEKTFNPLESLALCGSGFSWGMERILKYFTEEHSISQKADFLKKEYGIGGFSNLTPRPFRICSMDTIGMRKTDIRFSYCDEDMNIVESGCSWKQLAETITDMVSKGTYKRRVS